MNRASSWVYIVVDKPYGTLYIGMTNNLARRAHEHKTGAIEGFSKRYGLTKLVYCEECATAPQAIAREKVLKKWKRAWKIELIERLNPTWRDLYEDLNA